MRAEKWEGVKPQPLNFFSVNFYDLKYMSLKFGNDILNTFERIRYPT